MNLDEQSRFGTLYQKNLAALTRQGKACFTDTYFNSYIAVIR